MKRSHGLTLMGLIMAIGIFQISNCRLESEIWNVESEILVVDLSKKLPDNPYQTEYERMLWPTVRIKALFSTGSGVVIGDYIITAAHVVGNNSTVEIELFYPITDGLSVLCGSVAMTDTAKDLALIKPSRPLSYTAKLAPADYRPYIFTPVYSVGCSLGFPPRPSNGIISVITDKYWEITSPILPGNSGGPVYDGRTYEVIGIAVWVRVYKDQLVTTMAGVVPIQSIYEFINSNHENTKGEKH
ncbi:MAG: serine protease [Candidatus Brocadiia bacterium]